MLAVLVLWCAQHSLHHVAPLLGPAGLSGQTDRVLLTFGLASLAGVWISGLLIDRRLRALTLLSLAGFALAVLALGLAGTHAPAVYVAVAAWGVAFGGSPTLLQTASAEAAGPGRMWRNRSWPRSGTWPSRAAASSADCCWTPPAPAPCPGPRWAGARRAAGRNGARPWLSGGTAPRPASVKAAGIPPDACGRHTAPAVKA